jgi:hypothetical protein
MSNIKYKWPNNQSLVMWNIYRTIEKEIDEMVGMDKMDDVIH